MAHVETATPGLGRRRLARHPHLALLVAVAAALATEPAVQAGRDTSSAGESVLAAVALLARAAVAGMCLFVAWEGQRRLRLFPVLGCTALLGAGWLVLHLAAGVVPDQDLGFYAEDGRSLLRGEYPASEYPTGAVALFALETWIGGDPPRVLHALVMLACQLVVVACIWSVRTAWSGWLAAFVAVWPMNLFHWEFRYDQAPTACLVAGLALALRGRWTIAGLALGLGTTLKWTPALAFLVLLAWSLARRASRASVTHVAGFLAGAAVLTLPFLAWQPTSVLEAYRLQAGRGLTGESLWYLLAAPFGLATRPELVSDDAAAGAVLNAAVTVAQVGVVIAMVVLAVRVVPLSAAVAVAALTPVAFLLTNRVFSSQFLVLLVAAWAFATALVARSAFAQLAVGAAMGAATFANALVHPYTAPFAWELASGVLFAVGLSLTGWLLYLATRPEVGEVPP